MIVIDINGKVTERKYNGDIQEIYDAIGCNCFDIVRLGGSLTMFVDDEGLLKPDPIGRVNWKATYLRLMDMMRNPQEFDWDAMRRFPPLIVGDVAILDSDEGNTVDLDDDTNGLILEWLGEDQTREA